MNSREVPTDAQVLTNALKSFLPAALEPIAGPLSKLLALDQLDEIHEAISTRQDDCNFFDRVLDHLSVQVSIQEDDLARVPKEGPVVIVSNHPFGILDGLMVGSVLTRVRPDAKILVNSLLRAFPAGERHFIFVNPFGTPEAARENLRGMKECLHHLREGGCLAVFPAGEVSSLAVKARSVVDPKWNPSIARLIRSSKAAVVPVYVKGRNSLLFQALGLVHPRLRTLLLGHELCNKKNQTIEVRVGSVITAKRAEQQTEDQGLMEYLRLRTYVLGKREPSPEPALVLPRLPLPKPVQETIIDPVAPDLLQADIDALPVERLLAESGDMRVFCAKSHEMPHLFREIARLRETTFRAAGEGTGASLDIDTYDAHYLQLFIWNAATREVVGAYRLGQTDEILARFGRSGLYTSSLFAYGDNFLERIGVSLEMGRSFVRQEYQRSFAPLLLLWRGVGQFCVRHPRYRTLFGPVSISNSYHPISRQLMVTFFRGMSTREELSTLVRAKNPLRQRGLRGLLANLKRPFSWDIEELNAVLADIETDQKGVPILIRQYLKLGGKLLSFNIDRAFANSLDGLIVVDLEKTEPKLLERYLGADGMKSFMAYRKSVGQAR